MNASRLAMKAAKAAARALRKIRGRIIRRLPPEKGWNETLAARHLDIDRMTVARFGGEA